MTVKIKGNLGWFLGASLILVCAQGAQAQGVQNFINNEVNKIQQDYTNGTLNTTQAANLQHRAMQIQNQEGIDMSQNGGYLTPQQSQQIKSEMQNVNQGVNNSVNGNGYVNNGYQQGNYGRRGLYNNGNYGAPNATPAQYQNWRNNQAQLQNNPNYVPGATGQPYNGHHHHQHRYEAQNQ